jgi:predicted AlkP superfamily phosphohydrolase/phosphomutase
MPDVIAPRVLAIGIDSAALRFVEAHLGSLPTLRRLFATGAVLRLASPADVLSASVWPTFYTASPPGEHGQYYPMQWDHETMRLRRVGSDWLPCEPFWRPLARDGLRVTTLDVQTLQASPGRDTLEVVNWGSQSFSSFHCSRPDVGREIVRLFGRHPMGPDVPVDKTRRRLAASRRQLLDGARRRGALVRWLLAREPWQLFVAVFPECHRAGHYFWSDEAGPDADTLLEVHAAVDREIGEVLACVDRATTTVVVFSLHGMGPNNAQAHFLPELLDRLNARFAAELGHAPPRRASVLRTLRERVPGPVQEAVARAVPEHVRDWVTSRALAGGLDGSPTPGFVLPSGGEGFVRLTLAGRERGGLLERGGAGERRYHELLRDALLGLRTTDGAPLVEDVVAVRERFAGARAEALPDVAITWRELAPAHEVDSPHVGRLRARLGTGRGGNHVASAFAVIDGPGRDAPPVAAMRDIRDLASLVRDLATASPVRG